jgi:hypothetical protein
VVTGADAGNVLVEALVGIDGVGTVISPDVSDETGRDGVDLAGDVLGDVLGGTLVDVELLDGPSTTEATQTGKSAGHSEPITITTHVAAAIAVPVRIAMVGKPPIRILREIFRPKKHNTRLPPIICVVSVRSPERRPVEIM